MTATVFLTLGGWDGLSRGLGCALRSQATGLGGAVNASDFGPSC